MAVESVQATTLRGDPELKQRLQELCRTDNRTNFLYVVRAWLVIAVAIGGAIGFHHAAAAQGWPWLWNVPVSLLAILVVGASQHQLAGATHEATHHTLFRNRLLNELVSDWLCMFPLFSSTYTFRLYHLQHHQFINDPQRDPDFAMLRRSGHWLGFPVSRSKFLRKLVGQALLIELLRYAAVRARSNALLGSDESPYQVKTKGSKLPVRASLLYILALSVGLVFLYRWRDPVWVLVAPAIAWVVIATFLIALPDRHYEQPRIRPVYPRRFLASSRMGFITLLFTGLTYGQLVSGQPLWAYFALYWLVPLLTAFQFFMVLRQLVQHGNCDRSFIGNTRVFLVNPLLRYAVFPFGMDYHAPHHMFATVPHYRLPALHDFLLRYPEYRQECAVVQNYLVPSGHRPDRRPTIVEVLGPDYATDHRQDVWVDNTVLDAWEVDDKQAILDQARRSAASNQQPE